VLASEWIKLVSVRSTVWTLVVTAVVGIGLGAIVTSAQAARYSARTLAAQQAFDPTRSSLSGILFAQLAIGVLGVLMVSAEYRTGTVRATFAAIPHRPVVLAAKALVFSAITFAVGEAVSFVAFVIGQSILSGHTPTASLSDPSALRAVIGAGLYLVVLGPFALGLATIIHHTAASISAFVGTLFVLPIIAAVLPSSYSDDVSRFLPQQIGTVMSTATLPRHRSHQRLGLARHPRRLRGRRPYHRRRAARTSRRIAPPTGGLTATIKRLPKRGRGLPCPAAVVGAQMDCSAARKRGRRLKPGGGVHGR
jgi:ABC-2 type transport system permease protein